MPPVTARGADSGTSFPSSPTTGRRRFRTDLGLEFFFDGTRWLSSELFVATDSASDGLVPFSTTPITGGRFQNPGLGRGLDAWIESIAVVFFVAAGGTALGASHKWVGVSDKRDAANAATTITTHNIDSGASATWRNSVVASGTVWSVSSHYAGHIVWTRTGTPGNLYAMTTFNCRLIAT